MWIVSHVLPIEASKDPHVSIAEQDVIPRAVHVESAVFAEEYQALLVSAVGIILVDVIELECPRSKGRRVPMPSRYIAAEDVLRRELDPAHGHRVQVGVLHCHPSTRHEV